MQSISTVKLISISNEESFEINISYSHQKLMAYGKCMTVKKIAHQQNHQLFTFTVTNDDTHTEI